jgi:hypothetical protein
MKMNLFSGRSGRRRSSRPEASAPDTAARGSAARTAAADADADRHDDPDAAAPTPPDRSAGGGGGARRNHGRGWWPRYRVLLLSTLGTLLVVLFIALAHSRNVHGELDPRAVDQPGSHALATLLDEHGVTVRRVTRPDDALAGVTARSIVFVPFPGLVPTDALRRAGDLGTGGVGQLVLVAPDTGTLAAVTDRITAVGDTEFATRPPGCSVDSATAAGSAQTGGRTYRADGGAACYPANTGATLVVSETRGGARLVVLGTGAFLTNGQLSQAGNAALGLNLLGADGSADEVRWLVPSPGSATTASDPSLSDIAPGWVGPAVLQLLVAALVAALWRARRLGPPVTEPLPVVVRSAEAMEGRARLYRRAQAMDRAAEALRTGARARLVPRLGLGHDAGGEPAPATVVEVIADWTGQPETDVHAALYGPAPADEAALVRLADELDSIVRDTLDPEVRRP